MSHLRLAAGFSLVAFAVGCSAEPAFEGVAGDEALSVADGYHALAPSSGVYQSLAVVGDTAFVGDNGLKIDVVDLATMRKTGSIAGRIPNDSLTSAGNKLIACGLRDDSPIDPFGHTPADRSYVLTVLDPSAKKITGEIELKIESLLDSSHDGQLVDLPDLSCRFDGSAMTVTFAQKHLGREVITFPLPALGASYDWKAIPNAKRTTIDVGGQATMKAAVVTDAGITYAAGGWGLRQQAPDATRAKSLRDEPREQLVDLEIRGERIYAADNSGALLVTTLDGKTVDRVAIADWLHAVTLTPTHVVVLGEKGLFVAKNRW